MRRKVPAEEQSDDEVLTSLVPDWKEGKMKRIEWKYLPITVLKRFAFFVCVTRIYAKMLQQHLLLVVCDEGCEVAEEQSDDEVRTTLVPDRREGKIKVIK